MQLDINNKQKQTEKIIEHKRVGRGTKFKIQTQDNKIIWKLGSEIDNKNLIKQYFKKINDSSNSAKITFIVRAFLLVFFAHPINANKINAKFKYCDTENVNHIIDPNMNCKIEYKNYLEFVRTYKQQAFENDVAVYAYRKFIIDDFVSECTKKVRIAQRNVSWNLIETENEEFYYDKITKRMRTNARRQNLYLQQHQTQNGMG